MARPEVGLVARHLATRMAWQDAEVAADIGEDCADRPAADPGGDLLRRWQVGEVGVWLSSAPGCRWGGARPAPGRHAE